MYSRQSPPWHVWSSSFFIVLGVTMILGKSGSPRAIHDYHGRSRLSWKSHDHSGPDTSHTVFPNRRRSSFTTVNWFSSTTGFDKWEFMTDSWVIAIINSTNDDADEHFQIVQVSIMGACEYCFSKNSIATASNFEITHTSWHIKRSASCSL